VKRRPTDDWSQFYILVNREVTPCDCLTWAQWFEEHKTDGERIVRQESAGRGWFVSTVFIGLDPSIGTGPPLLFETMVMGPRRVRHPELRDYAGIRQRYATWDAAEAGHRATVAMLQAALAVARGKVH
jgi:hypothetical protein